MILIWQAEGQVDGVSAVFSGAAVLSNKLAAVPVVITGMELVKQTPDSFPKLALGARCCCGGVLPGGVVWIIGSHRHNQKNKV